MILLVTLELESGLAPLQLDRLVVLRVVARPGRTTRAQTAVLQRDFDLAGYEDLVHGEISEDGPEYGKRGRDGCDIHFQCGQDDGCGPIPCWVKGWVGRSPGVDYRGKAPYRKYTCSRTGYVSNGDKKKLPRSEPRT